MGVYSRYNKLWFKFRGPNGVWHRKPTSFVVGQEAQAELAFRELVEKLQAGAEVADVEVGVATVRSYARRWLEDRKARGVGNAPVEEARLEKWVFPVLGSRPLSELRPKELQAFVRGLRDTKTRLGEPLAPRSVRHIWADLKAMLKEAVADEVIVASPAALKRGDLPPKRDKDPLWRAGAVFTVRDSKTVCAVKSMAANDGGRHDSHSYETEAQASVVIEGHRWTTGCARCAEAPCHCVQTSKELGALAPIVPLVANRNEASAAVGSKQLDEALASLLGAEAELEVARRVLENPLHESAYCRVAGLREDLRAICAYLRKLKVQV